MALDIDVENGDLDFLALLEHLRGMLHTLGPRHVRDVNQPVDAILDLDEGAEISEVAHATADHLTLMVLLGDHTPGVRLGLLHAERDPPRILIDIEDHDVDVVGDLHQLRRMLDTLFPGHLGDVHQTLDAFLEFDERTVVRQAHHLALHARAHRVFLGNTDPRILGELLVAQRYPLTLGIVVENDDIDLIADLEHLRRVGNAAPRHVGDVQQPIDATQVCETPIVGDVLDHTTQDVAGDQLGQGDRLLLGARGVENGLTRHHHVGAASIDLDHANLDLFASHGLEIANRTQVHLGTRQEGAHADVNGKSTLDPVGNDPGNRSFGLEGLLDTTPDLHLLGFVARDNNVAVAVLAANQ